jgi:hypothetical protein
VHFGSHGFFAFFVFFAAIFSFDRWHFSKYLEPRINTNEPRAGHCRNQEPKTWPQRTQKTQKGDSVMAVALIIRRVPKGDFVSARERIGLSREYLRKSAAVINLIGTSGIESNN